MSAPAGLSDGEPTQVDHVSGGRRPPNPAGQVYLVGHEEGVRPRGRRVIRIRRIELASVLRVALVLCLFLVGTVFLAGVGLWSMARSSGLIDHLEGLARDYGFEDFRFLPGRMLTYALLAGPLLTVFGALFCVAATLLVNLVLRVVGGIAVSVDEERESAPENHG